MGRIPGIGAGRDAYFGLHAWLILCEVRQSAVCRLGFVDACPTEISGYIPE